MTNPEVMSFILGALLVLIGVVGGGFEIKEAKIPKVGGLTRLFSVFMGISFISLGIYIAAQHQTNSPSNTAEARPLQEPSQPVQPQSQPVRFTITNQLGDMQIAEQMTIVLNGRNVGTLAVSEDRPRSSLTVTVPHAGEYSYTVEGSAIFAANGTAVELFGAGQGRIDVYPGHSFELAGSISGNTWYVTLLEN